MKFLTDIVGNDARVRVQLGEVHLTDRRRVRDLPSLTPSLLLVLAEISIANNADHAHTSTTNNMNRNDTVITFTNGTPDIGDDEVVMVLEDYASDLTYTDFVVVEVM